MSTITEIPFQQLLDALLDEATPLQPRYLYRLSDLEPPELALLEGNWTRVPVWRRQSLLEDLEQLGEADPLLSFEAVGRMALHDADPIVRSRATHLLWEIETHDLIPVFLQMLASDPDVQARASAANLLGRFVYRGEVDQLPEQLLQDLQDQLLQAASSQASSLVRRRALESISYSSRHEVQPLIESAYASGDKDWMATALLAMGRSADDRWAETVLSALDHKYPILRAEAARAAGELEIPTAVSRLIELIEDSDDDVRQAAIWSLSQIGGEGVREALEKIWEQSEDEDEIDLLENALDNLAFTEEMPPFNLFDIPAQDQHPSNGKHRSHKEERDFPSGSNGRSSAYPGWYDEEDFDFDEEDDPDFLDLEDEYFNIIDDEEFPDIEDDNEDLHD